MKTTRGSLPPRGDLSSTSRIRSFARLVGVAALFAAAACASAPDRPDIDRRDAFPLDPREELAGPFPVGVEEGWRALTSGDPAAAEAAFATARPHLAAEIGLIESRVLLKKFEAALRSCRDALGVGTPTVPLLVACGEAQARSGHPFEAHELYARAAARSPRRDALRDRTRELSAAAVESLRRTTAETARGETYDEARARIDRAIALAPGDAALHAIAGDVELAAGHRDLAFERYREAYRLDPANVAVQEKLAELAIEKDPALAVTVLDSLARKDPRHRERAAEARLAFRVSNWPAPEREAAHAERVTRAGAATLVWWMCPEIREAKVSSSIIASDVVSRRDTRAVMRAVSLGLLDVDAETHRARPDAPLTRRSAARMMLRLLRMLGPGATPKCLEGSEPARSAAEALQAAIGCGFLPESEGNFVRGLEFTRGIDRVRMLAAGKGEPG